LNISLDDGYPMRCEIGTDVHYRRTRFNNVLESGDEVYSIEDVLSLDISQYCELVRAQHGRKVSDPKYSPLPVLRGASRHSYLDELADCREFFLRYKRFANIPDVRRQRVAGTVEPEDRWFGSMEAAGRFKHLVNEDPEIIGKYIDKIPLTGELDPLDIADYMNEMLAIQGIALSTSTRLLAMKRPDSCLPITTTNRNGLQRIPVLGNLMPSMTTSSAKKSADRYVSVLLEIWRTPWCSSERPTGEVDGLIWDGRVALLDSIVYDPC